TIESNVEIKNADKTNIIKSQSENGESDLKSIVIKGLKEESKSATTNLLKKFHL
ncbi:MAG: 5-methyltetrahydrofolate-homocysteine methyltransferase, partial [Clostridium butyricum DORA_1]